MAQLRYANINFKNRFAGTLSETPDGGSAFEYASEFTEAIACALPRDSGRHPWPTGLHPFFEHLGPEGWLRSRQAHAAEIAIEDDFGILMAYGSDCIGAVSVHDPAAPPSQIHGKPLDDLTAAAVQSRRTISGVTPKMLVAERDGAFFAAGPAEPAPYIAKFPTDDIGTLVSNEDLSLRLARLLLGDSRVTRARRTIIKGIQRPALVVTRFDRTKNNEKLRLEDFAQILTRPRLRDFSGKYDAGFEDGGDAIRRHSTRPEIDVLRYFQQIVAYALIGNCDCHLKNFSLLETPEGLRLSPAYDIVNTYVYAPQGYSTEFGLRIDGMRHELEAIDQPVLTRLGTNLGLPPRAVAGVFLEFAKKRKKVAATIIPPRGMDRDDDYRGFYADIVASAYVRICPE
ncbi:MAG: HipA domain-containing protein [Proteobacteria bacterium]|nr:HipA domain-containing protein [Pseudomonadota bacterium]